MDTYTHSNQNSSEKVILKLESISRHYENPAGESIPVLQSINLQVKTGDSIAIVGPSGSGKSTLLNIIGALDSPTSGRVLFQDRDLSRLDEKELAALRNRQVGFIFQLHHLLPQYTVLENVLIPTLANASKNRLNRAERRARDLLNRVGLESRMSYRPGILSGGERQRVAVVRALINNPKILLADEPTGSLDRSSADEVAKLIMELKHEQNVTLILVTHSLELADRMKYIFELTDGILKPYNEEDSI
ncbi:ATP-binding cassette domain-containing protein [Candidatus Poribacteria bacterium]|nr:ATP-binding cassette domain-containing protein [Candidatus Poribacteria bacterium]